MAEKQPKKFIKAQGNIIQDTVIYFKLIIRLMADPRVNPFIKIIPIASVVFVISPLDIPGPIDDAAILGLGVLAFIELCPKEVVDEHMRALNQTIGSQWKDVPPSRGQPATKDVIEGEFRDKKS